MIRGPETFLQCICEYASWINEDPGQLFWVMEQEQQEENHFLCGLQ